jgi:hypothetical protein
MNLMATNYRETPVLDPVEETSPVTPTRRNDMGGGVALVAIGLFLLVARFLDIGQIFLLLLGGGFLAWGIATRTAGLLIPGGILSGIGLGVLLMEGPFGSVSGDAEGGVFLLSFALGWFSITALSALFTRDTQWWAVIPGTIMALIGTGVLVGGAALTVLEFVGDYWPVALILVGLYLLFRRQKAIE